MAVLTTLVGLLELKHLQMEGEDGTGSLESDIQLMEVSCSATPLLCQSLLMRMSVGWTLGKAVNHTCM